MRARMGGSALLAIHVLQHLAVHVELVGALAPSVSHWQDQGQVRSAPCRDLQPRQRLRSFAAVHNLRERPSYLRVDQLPIAQKHFVIARAKGADHSGEGPTSRWKRLRSQVQPRMKRFATVAVVGLLCGLAWQQCSKARPDVAYTTLLATVLGDTSSSIRGAEFGTTACTLFLDGGERMRARWPVGHHHQHKSYSRLFVMLR
eukprot:6474759-Amphidinium_carterae.1